jgi:hypothetical protein
MISRYIPTLCPKFPEKGLLGNSLRLMTGVKTRHSKIYQPTEARLDDFE